jgi:hypothetical protein
LEVGEVPCPIAEDFEVDHVVFSRMLPSDEVGKGLDAKDCSTFGHTIAKVECIVRKMTTPLEFWFGISRGGNVSEFQVGAYDFSTILCADLETKAGHHD